ncbi:reverse transcriptase domain-containing protein [Tanacetum coccineum]
MRTRSQTRNRPQQQVTPNIEPFDLEEPNGKTSFLAVVTMAPINVLWRNFSKHPPRVTRMQSLFPRSPQTTLSLNMVCSLLCKINHFSDMIKKILMLTSIIQARNTSTLKFPNVLNTSIKLMLFPFSLEGAARIWLEKEPPRSILIWDDLVSKFINQFFPPSKTTNLRNEVTNFQQRFDESFSEAWDRFKDLLRACPHHGFSELYQLDTFYNALNSDDQDSLNSAAGGNFLDKIPRDCLAIIERKSKVRETKQSDWCQTTVKAVEESCVTCGGAHSYRNCPATDGNVYHDNIQEYFSQAAAVNYNQGNTGYRLSMIANQIRPPGFPLVQNNQNNQRNNQNRGNNYTQSPIYQPPAYQAPSPQTQGVSKDDFQHYIKANDAVMKNMQSQNQNMQNQMTNLTDMLTKFMNTNTASTSDSGSLPSNTIANLRGDMKAITTRSGVSYDGPSIQPPPSSLPKVVEHKPEARALIDVHGEQMTLRHDDQSITFKVGDTKTFSYNTIESVNRVDVIDVACEEFAQEVLGFSNISKSGNPTPTLEPILSTSPPSLTPFEGGDFILEEIKACLTSKSIPPGIDDADFDLKEDLLTLERLLNSDPSSTLPPEEQKFEELKTVEPSSDELPELELKDLPPHLEYAFLEGTDKLPVIITKDLKDEDKTALLKVLRSHKRAITWKI